MNNNKKFYINGEWVDPISPKTLDVINPANEEIVSEISLGSEADVNKAVAAAKKAFLTFSLTSREERLELFEKIMNVKGLTNQFKKEIEEAIPNEKLKLIVKSVNQKQKEIKTIDILDKVGKNIDYVFYSGFMNV